MNQKTKVPLKNKSKIKSKTMNQMKVNQKLC